MRKLVLCIVCLAAMMAGTGLKAQEITITLVPGWNWISYTNAVPMEIGEALGDFTPVQGDIVKSKNNGTATFNGTMWRGSLTQFTPGQGYHYFSNRTETASIVFWSGVPQVVVTTSEPTDITFHSAVCGGNVVSCNGDYVSVTLRGFCWSTNPNPTFNDNYIEVGSGLGSYTVSMTELMHSTTYYVRAFAVTTNGTFYGEEVVFSTPIEGVINGLFSINSSGEQIYFSQGNLQYQASTNTWKFAENQYDYVGSANSNISSSYSGWIDLFGWGTSGWNNGNTYYHPWDSNNSSGETYGPLGQYNLTGYYANADWGVYNPISNGGNTANQWRTLTKPEWNYVLKVRSTTSGIRYAKAKVNNVCGVVLLPDNWSASTYVLNNTNGGSYSNNIISAEDWANTFEANGAVFLPAAGSRSGTALNDVGSWGSYWSASCSTSYTASAMYFYSSGLSSTSNSSRYAGMSVRLVRVAE